jgi:hypothetical protein
MQYQSQTNTNLQGCTYKLTCLDHKKVYTGETEHPFHTTHKKHILNIKYNKEDPGYATYIKQYVKMEDTMEETDCRKMSMNEHKQILYLYEQRK